MTREEFCRHMQYIRDFTRGWSEYMHELYVSVLVHDAEQRAEIARLREALTFYSGPSVPFDEDYETRDYEDGSSRGVIVKFGKVARQALKETTT